MQIFSAYFVKMLKTSPKKGVKLLERLPPSVSKKQPMFREKPAVSRIKRRFFESAGP